jgi:hypothetical protein
MQPLSSLNRQILFLIGCIPARLLLVVVAIYLQKNKMEIVNSKHLPYNYMNNYIREINIKNIFSVICILIGFGFLSTFISNRKIGFFGGNAWWSNLRPIHGINFIMFGVFSIQGYSWAPIILVLDIIIGLLGFGMNYLV